jgi:acetyl-CoA carboxylase carboxyltransferase component/biotin carboxyl carrier protein
MGTVERTAPVQAAPATATPGDVAPTTGTVGVPVLVDPTGRTWVLPACRVVPGSPGTDLLETTELPPALHDAVLGAAQAEASRRGPGAHCPTFTLGAGSAPIPAASQLDGWPLVEEVLGLDLPGAGIGQTSRVTLPEEEPPAPIGHAVCAQVRAPLADEDAELLHLRLPLGPGVRVVTQAAAGEPVGAGPVLRVVAHGRDRATAMARLHRALSDCAVVVAGAPTNRASLLAVLAAHAGHTARPASAPGPDPLAVLVAAVRASDAERAIQRTAFHARAARGRPEPVVATGVPVTLVHAGQPYTLVVHETGPDRFRIDTGEHVAELAVQRHDGFEWTVTCAGRRHHVVATGLGSGCALELDGVAHQVDRDEGLPVRAEWPALIVSVAVAEGDTVAPGDPLVVVEAMKMESTIRATAAGTVTGVDVLPNEQVDAGMPLVRIRPPAPAPTAESAAAPGSRVSFAGMALADTSGRPPFERVYAALSSHLLGYDLDPAALRGLLAEQRAFANRASAADGSLLAAEDAFLDLFSELGRLWQVDREVDDEHEDLLTEGTTSAREYLIGYLQWLDPDRVGMPEPLRRRLARVLGRYGVTDLRRNPALEDAVVLLFSTQARLPKLAGVVTGILERRLRHRDRILPLVQPTSAGNRYDRLVTATQGQLPAIADLALDARFRFVDEPVVEAGRVALQAEMDGHLAALAEDPRRADRAERITALVDCPQPMRETILRRRLAGGVDPDLQSALLEVRARRWYRTRPLQDLRMVEVRGAQLCCADYDWEHRRIHVVLAFTPLSNLAELGAAIAEHLRTVDPGRAPVVDVMCWRPESQPNGDDLAATLREQVAGWDLGRPLWRLDVTVSSLAPEAEPELRTQYVTFRTAEDGSGLVEDVFYRNLHPMLAKRLELWRLANFDLTRLPSSEDVYLFHGVAKANPKDHRLFALAEVRDMTPLPAGRGGRTSFPMLERLGLQAIIAMRRARVAFPQRDRPQANRITLFVRRPWTVPREHWGDLVEMLVPLASGAGLEMVVIRTQVPEADGTLRPTVLNVDGIIQRSITITEEAPRDDIVRPLTRYRQKVLTAQRFGVPYPFEILRMFAPPPGTVGKFKPAHFEELDLDETGETLVPVLREPGLNTSNLVVGLLTTYTEAYPEGMTRVAMLSDPTRGLGNLAEPECRRVNACLALALERGIPVEWFATSSGALISMQSGTENMDWIALTLRRIIEFTQAGGEINVLVTGINVGGQPYWNAEATMLMHTKGILVMMPNSAMVLTGKQALDFSGGVSADDNFGIGGYDRVMGPNGQAQYWAPSLPDACELLLHHYRHTYVAPGERFPRRVPTIDPFDRDVQPYPHAPIADSDFAVVGDIFSSEKNPERKKPFDVRSVMRAVTDQDSEPLERWQRWRGGETSVVWDARIGGMSVLLLGLESHPVPRRGFVPADGPAAWTSGTLFPQASRKTARAVNAATGNRPMVVLANLSGFDGSPESMRHWQLEYGAEIGRAVTNFRGPIVFVVISRYHGGAFVVFSKALNASMEVAAVEGSFASVIGGAPAAATVFAREVRTRVEADPRVVAAKQLLAGTSGAEATERRAALAEITEQVRSEKLGEQAAEFDAVHTIDRALQMGSVDEIISPEQLRPWVIAALERGMARTLAEEGRQA